MVTGREQSLGIERTTSALDKINLSASKIKASAEEMLKATDLSVARLPDRIKSSLDLSDLIETIEDRDEAQPSPVFKTGSKLEADDPSFRPQD